MLISWLFFPCSRGAVPILPGAPSTLISPNIPPNHLAGGFRKLQGFFSLELPLCCYLRANEAAGGGSDTQHFTHRLTHSFLVLQLEKVIFMEGVM